MLIAVSGSQGSGKSTVINGLKEFGANVITRKSSRSILTDWNVSLEEVNNDPELTLKFQLEITKRKFEDEQHTTSQSTTPSGVWFTERTHADLFTYALVTLGKDNSYTDWLNEYYNVCLKYNQMYDRVYYLRGGLFTVEHDGTRGSNHHYSRMVDLTMSDVTKQMIHSSKLHTIETANLDDRVETIIQQTN